MCKSGLTLIELMVVMAIVGVLVALLLPAVQMAREAARQTQCRNHLHQIGVAMHAYVTDYEKFPLPWLYVRGEIWNQNVGLLPYLEHTELYNAINTGLTWRDPENTTVGYTSPGIFLCPSDGRPQSSEYGVTSYLACNGSGVWPGGLDSPVNIYDYPGDGLFAGVPLAGPRDCLDGLSHTAAFSERVHGGFLRGLFVLAADQPFPKLGIVYGVSAIPPTQRELLKLCQGTPNSLGGYPSGRPWFGAIQNVPYNHLLPPGQPVCWGELPMSGGHSVLSASSRHRGGVNLLLGDGHVRFVTNDIDLIVWRALGTRSGGEQTDSAF